MRAFVKKLKRKRRNGLVHFRLTVEATNDPKVIQAHIDALEHENLADQAKIALCLTYNLPGELSYSETVRRTVALRRAKDLRKKMIKLLQKRLKKISKDHKKTAKRGG